jgi:zinc/manganese transport system permease protein
MLTDLELLLPALVAGLLVVITHVPLGREVIRRGIIFLDLSIAQVAAVGALLAVQAGLPPGSAGNQLCSFAAALSGAAFLGWTEKHWRDTQEAIIGVLFVVSATGAMMLLAHDAHGSDALKDILAGQILWVSWSSLAVGGLFFAVMLPILFSSRLEKHWWFYIAFSVCVTLSVQWVGVYLVFSTLVIPALATRALSGHRQVVVASLLGIGGYAGGLILSVQTDLPTGPLIVWGVLSVSLIYALGMRLFSPRG